MSRDHRNSFDDFSGADFGRWFRELRIGRGFKSAPLSRRAGLSRAYVSALELGKAFPRPDTITALADALELSGSDREEFIRRALAAGKPDFVKDAQAVGRIPGAAIWSRLPPILFSGKLNRYADADDVLIDMMVDLSVPAIASTLAWVHLNRRPMSRAQVRTLQSVISSRHRQGADELDVTALLAALVATWRSMCFADDKTADLVTRELRYWDFDGGIPVNDLPALPPRVSVGFHHHGLSHFLGYEYAPATLARRVHDALIARCLWIDLDLDDRLGCGPESWCVGLYEEMADLREWLDSPLNTCPPVAALPSESGDYGAVWLDGARSLRWHNQYQVGWWKRVAEFALRLYDLPDLGQMLLGRPIDSILPRLDEVDRLELLWAAEPDQDPELPAVVFGDGVEGLKLDHARSAVRRRRRPAR